MKILFVSLYALEVNTSVSKSNYGIIKGLSQLNHEITLVVPEVDQSLPYYDNSYNLNNVKIIRIKNTGIGERLAATNHSNPSKFKKYLLSWVKKLYSSFSVFDRSIELVNKAETLPVYEDFYDIVISTSDPKTSHLMVKKMISLGLKYGRWIQHWGDPLYGDISKKVLIPSFVIKMIERNIISKANKVIYVSPFTAEFQKGTHPSMASKLFFVPLPCDEIDPVASVEHTVTNNKECHAVYLGDYSSHIRNILPLYNAVNSMTGVQLTIAGNTDLKLNNTRNVIVFPRLKQNEVKQIENSSDIIISVGNLSGTQIPGKIYYAASSNKRILVTVDGANHEKMKAYLSSFDRFDVCLNTEEDIAKTLQAIIDCNRLHFNTPQVLIPENVAKNIIS